MLFLLDYGVLQTTAQNEMQMDKHSVCISCSSEIFILQKQCK